MVDLQSDHIGIRIIYDRGQVLVNSGPISVPLDQWFELTDVVHAYEPEIEKVYNFPETQLAFDISASTQLERIANLILNYCMPFFIGDFSKINDIRTVERERVEKLLEQLKKLNPKNKRSID